MSTCRWSEHVSLSFAMHYLRYITQETFAIRPSLKTSSHAEFKNERTENRGVILKHGGSFQPTRLWVRKLVSMTKWFSNFWPYVHAKRAQANCQKWFSVLNLAKFLDAENDMWALDRHPWSKFKTKFTTWPHVCPSSMILEVSFRVGGPRQPNKH